jgi:putative ABC transport system ATP-binding protein
MIQINKIKLSYPAGIVFQDLSFSIEKESNVCFSRPSGSGKSSVLKMLQGYVRPDEGQITIDNLQLNPETVKKIRSMMAYVPQNINLPVDNGMELLKMLRAENITGEVKSHIKKLGMSEEMIKRSFDEMSGGQKQRVVVAVCLSLERDILLLDEPTSSLDDESVKKLIKVVRGLEGKTIVSASHNQMWMESVDKVVVL